MLTCKPRPAHAIYRWWLAADHPDTIVPMRGKPRRRFVERLLREQSGPLRGDKRECLRTLRGADGTDGIRVLYLIIECGHAGATLDEVMQAI